MTVRQTKKNNGLLIIGISVIVVGIVLIAIFLTRSKPAAFELSNLVISPAQAQPGQTVMIVVTVTNTGGSTGNYAAEFKINNNLADTRSINLAPEKSHMVSFSVEETKPGTYSVEIGGLTGQFTIVEPAVFQLTNLIIEPTEVRPGQSVGITAMVTNGGGVPGEYDVELNINSLAINNQSVSLSANENKQVVFTYTGETPGTYTVEIGGLIGKFIVRPTELRTWTITDADIPRLFSLISDVELTAHFIPGNQAEFVMAGFPGVVNVGIMDGKLCEYPVGTEVYLLLPEIHDWVFFVDGTAYLSYTWFDPSIEIAPDVTVMPEIVSVTTEEGRAVVTYEW